MFNSLLKLLGRAGQDIQHGASNAIAPVFHPQNIINTLAHNIQNAPHQIQPPNPHPQIPFTVGGDRVLPPPPPPILDTSRYLINIPDYSAVSPASQQQINQNPNPQYRAHPTFIIPNAAPPHPPITFGA